MSIDRAPRMTLDMDEALEDFIRAADHMAKLEALHRAAGRALFFRFLARIIEKTPVDTGRGRGGWGAGAKAMGLTQQQALAKKRGGSGARTNKAAYEEGLAQSAYTETIQGVTVTYTCTNGVHYMEFLEKGSSKQAPLGMVAISAAEMARLLGGRDLPGQIMQLYQAVWDQLGMHDGQRLRANDIARALGLTHGAGGLDL